MKQRITMSVGSSRVASFVRSRPVVSFFALALAFSWSAWLPAFAALDSPTSAVMMPGAFGPALAAAVLVRLRGESVRAWLADGLTPRVATRWYAVALALPVALGVVLGAGVSVIAGSFDATNVARAAGLYPLTLVSLTLLGGGQEEFGWRGYALPALQRRFDALTASVAVGVAWAVWHLPAFAFGIPGYTGSFARYGLLVVGLSIVLTWLYNSSGGSVLLAMVLHGGVNAAPTLGVAVVEDPSAVGISPYAVLVPAVWVVAAALVLRYGRETLSARSAEVTAQRADDAGTAGVSP